MQSRIARVVEVRMFRSTTMSRRKVDALLAQNQDAAMLTIEPTAGRRSRWRQVAECGQASKSDRSGGNALRPVDNPLAPAIVLVS